MGDLAISEIRDLIQNLVINYLNDLAMTQVVVRYSEIKISEICCYNTSSRHIKDVYYCCICTST